MSLENKIESFMTGDLHSQSVLVSEAENQTSPRPKISPFLMFEDGARMESNTLIFSKEEASFIGAHSYMNSGGYIRGRVFIGRFCSIGRRVTIGAGAHSLTGVSSSPVLRSHTVTKRPYTTEEQDHINHRSKLNVTVLIQSDVWVGDGAIIMPGITIGTGAVVGANAVVTKNVPPYAVIGGVPARVISYRFSNSIIRSLLKSEWWEYSIKDIETLHVGNVFQFMEELSASGFKPHDLPTYLKDI